MYSILLNNIIIYPDRRAGTIETIYKIISRTIITITIRYYNIIAITTHAHPSSMYTLNRGNIRGGAKNCVHAAGTIYLLYNIIVYVQWEE